MTRGDRGRVWSVARDERSGRILPFEDHAVTVLSRAPRRMHGEAHVLVKDDQLNRWWEPARNIELTGETDV